MLGAGELDEEARAGHVAGDGFVDESLRDAIGVLADQGVDGAAQAHGGAAGRGLAPFFGCGQRFAATRYFSLTRMNFSAGLCAPGFRVFQLRGFLSHLLPHAATVPPNLMRGIAVRVA